MSTGQETSETDHIPRLDCRMGGLLHGEGALAAVDTATGAHRTGVSTAVEHSARPHSVDGQGWASSDSQPQTAGTPLDCKVDDWKRCLYTTHYWQNLDNGAAYSSGLAAFAIAGGHIAGDYRPAGLKNSGFHSQQSPFARKREWAMHEIAPMVRANTLATRDHLQSPLAQLDNLRNLRAPRCGHIHRLAPSISHLGRSVARFVPVAM